jgi:hypothetical protein
MQTTRFTHLLGLALAVLCTLLVGSVGADNRKLEGTWNVTLRFPQETCDRPECACPGGMPNIPIPTLNTFLKGGGMVWSGGGNLFVGPGQGFWGALGTTSSWPASSSSDSGGMPHQRNRDAL